MRQLLPLLFIAATIFHPASGQDKIAIANATIIDGTGHPPQKHATVIVQGEKIVAITIASKKPPTDATVVDGTGKFLIPGLWNNDLHGPAYADAKASLLSLVSYGITTVRDMGAPLDDIVRLRAETASGTLVGPRLFVAGPLLEGPIPIQMALIVDLFSEKQARDEFRSLKQRDVNYVEVDTTLTPELYRAIADEARSQDLPLVGHIPATVSAWDVVEAHPKDVEHLGGRFLNVLISCSSDEAYFNHVTAQTYEDLLIAVKEKRPANEPQFKADFDERLFDTFDGSKAPRLFRLSAKSGVVQTPTLYVLKTLWETNRDNQKLNERDMKFGKNIFAKDLEVVGEMKQAGVAILGGTDGPYPQGGEALHTEVELLGSIPAAMGVSKDVGTIEVGKTADLVLLDADPLTNISNTRKIDAVILHGRLFSKDDFSSMRNH